ncbi:MFS transporter [Achromobacter sp. Marseille-Q4962]|uniref:MFS transporter n=2 Tax=unclassified Achromobacter TaxID=2626865 RepID=UPI002073F103|nr:MFS transporter [Achromobacter sp. Marseille-Q4962]
MNTACRSAALPAKPAATLLPLVTLAIGFVMAMLDVTIVNVALPEISRSLDAPLARLVWIVDGYTLAFAALLLLAGACADRWGAKPVYLAGLAVFVVASALCGAAPDASTLIAARLLQGLGAALFMPSSLSLLTHAYQEDGLRNRMLAAWSAIVAVAGAAGPLAGGLLIDRFGWRGVFLVNIPLGLAGLWLAQRHILPAPRRPRSLNPLSHLLGIAMLGALCFVLIQGNVYGWTSAPIAFAAAAGLGAGILLARRERRHASPILPRALFATPRFAAANGVGLLINLGAYGQLFLLSLLLQQARHLDALQTGLQLVPMLAVFSLGSLLSGRLSARWTLTAVMLGGLSAATLAALAGAAAITPNMPYPLLAALAALSNLGVSLAVPAMTATVMQIAGAVHSNGAAAALNANRQCGALIGVALMGTILHALPRWQEALPVAYAVITLSFALALALVWRYLRNGSAAQVRTGAAVR